MSNDKLPISIASFRDATYETYYDECGFFPVRKHHKPTQFWIEPRKQGFQVEAFEARVLRDVFRIKGEQVQMIIDGINSGDDIYIKPSTREISEAHIQRIERMRTEENITRPNIFRSRRVQLDISIL